MPKAQGSRQPTRTAGVSKIVGSRGTTYEARWRVHGRQYSATFPKQEQAEAHLVARRLRCSAGSSFLDLFELSRRMGHSTHRITADLYAHLYEEPNAERADRIAAQEAAARARQSGSVTALRAVP